MKVERWRVAVFTGVLLGHLGLALWLPRAMGPSFVPPDDVVLQVEFFEPPPLPEPSAPDTPPAPEQPPPERPRTQVRRAPASAMEAVIETPAEPTADAEPPREFVAPERDPFSRPPSAATGFGRRAAPDSPARSLPRIAGEAPPDAPLQGLGLRRRGTREIVEFVGALIGGGPNAPVEVRCGGRLNGGGVTTAESFSPAWQQHYGCSDSGTGAGYDGRVELPENIAR